MTQGIFKPGRGPFTARPVFFVALGVAVLAAIFLALHIAGGAILERQKEAVLREKIRAGRLLVAHLSDSAVLPLLGDDAIALGNLARMPSAGGSILFIAVTDGGNVIRAHTDPTHIGEILRMPPSATDGGTEDGVASRTYPLPAGGRVIDLSRPLVIRNKVVGSAHVVLSRESLDRAAEEAAGRLQRFLMVLGALFAAGVAGVAILFAHGGSTSWRFVTRREERRAGDGPAYRVMAIRDEPSGRPGEATSGEESRSPGPAPSVLGKALTLVGFPAETEKRDEEPGPLPGPRVARNQATVLVSNIRGFRAYADSRRPEEILEGLDAYFDIAETVIAAAGGRASCLSGDTVVAVFGGTAFLPDHTSRAVRAALELQAAFREAGAGKQPILGQVAIGINSGVILSCELGSSRRSGPVMIGEIFKSADALAMMAGPGEIVIGREIYQYLGTAVSADPLPPREILDRTGSWENFRLQDDLRKRV